MARKKNGKIRYELWLKSKLCFVCLKPINVFTDASIEHVIPRSKGGSCSKRNLSISHQACNQQRSNITCRLVWEEEFKKQRSRPEKRYHLKKPRPEKTYLFDFKKIPFDKTFSHEAMDFCFSNEFSEFYHQYGSVWNEIDTSLVQQALNYLRNKHDLIRFSKCLENDGTQRQWKLLFGMLFLEKFFMTDDKEFFVHGIWRIDQFLYRSSRSTLSDHLHDVLIYCWHLDPETFRRYEDLKNARQPRKEIE